MIKTKTVTEHQICCPCGGEIRMRSEHTAVTKPNPFEAEYCYLGTPLSRTYFQATQKPTCTKCCKTFKIEFNTTDFTIKMEED